MSDALIQLWRRSRAAPTARRRLALTLATMAALAALVTCGRFGLEAGEPVAVPTRAGFDFADFTDAAPEGVTIAGRLILPAEGALRGAAILSHGAGGTGARQDRAAELLADAGIAALVLDHFSNRGVRSVAADQLRVGEQQMAADIFAARSVLAERLDLAPDRIGAIGWSKGATAVMLAAVGRLGEALDPDDEPLAFAAAFYPFCGFDLDEEALASPLLLLLGGRDDWTPSAPCLRQAEAWAKRGQPVDWALWPDAAHGFDSRSGSFRAASAITVRDTSRRCTLTVEATGRTVTLDRSHALADIPGRRAFLEACGVRGVRFEGNDEARAASLDRLLRFVEQALE
ncbi:MAG: dienelactone hydrolase family protein [Pseudomonadota bacterium]